MELREERRHSRPPREEGRSAAKAGPPPAGPGGDLRLVLLNMRRSAAPSQLQGKPFKKPKFTPPARSNPSLNEEITKLDPDMQLSEVAADNTLLQSQADPTIYSLNLLPAGDSGREMNHRETSAVPAFNLHHTVQTWLRRHRLVPVHYR